MFDFILAISEVNAFLILRYFFYCGLRQEVMAALLEFCRNLVWQLINNIYIGKWEGGDELFPDSIHWLMTAPRHVKRYQNRMWICTAKPPINSTAAALNAEKIRTYCVYTPGVWICSDCNVQHVLIASSDG